MNPADDMASLQNALHRYPAPSCDPEPAPDVGAPRPRLQVEVACPACGRAVTLTDDRLADHRPPPPRRAPGPDDRSAGAYVPCPGGALRFGSDGTISASEPPRAPESTWRAVLFRAGSAPVQIAAPSSFEDAVKAIPAVTKP